MRIQGIPSPGPGLRLHLNENTGGCSPRVLEAIHALTPADIATYPDYREAVVACAAYFDVDPDWLLLTHGLDEGILMMAVGLLGKDKSPDAESLVPVPAFDPYFTATAAVGAKPVLVPPLAGFRFPTEAVLANVSPRTRLVFLNTPNNPTGQLVPKDAIARIAKAASNALVMVDEAYIEFGGESFLGELPAHRNVIVGRTFSKAYGLAGMRVGCVIGHPDTLEPLRQVTPVFNMDILGVKAMQAAIGDAEFLPRYAAEVYESRLRLYDACRRLGLEYWESAANFVLMRAGDRAQALVSALAARGVHVRDRTRDPYCPGCVRITAGILAHTDAAVAALDEVMAGSPSR
jgi:histidinol-phosphate aminotransferase